MNCSKCDHEMIEGKAFLETGFTSLTPKLVFKAETWRNHVMLESSDVVAAHYCDGCGALVLETGRRGLSTLEK